MQKYARVNATSTICLGRRAARPCDARRANYTLLNAGEFGGQVCPSAWPLVKTKARFAEVHSSRPRLIRKNSTPCDYCCLGTLLRVGRMGILIELKNAVAATKADRHFTVYDVSKRDVGFPQYE